MKKVFSVLIVVLMVVGVVSAQDGQMKAIQAGDESINFTFGGLGAFTLGAAGISGGISGSYFLSSDAAVRVGLQVRSNSTETPWNDLSGNNTNPGSDGSTSAFSLGVGADYLMYMGQSGRVRPYLGAGVWVTMNSSTVTPAIANNAPNGTVTETKNGTFGDGMTLGLAGIAGAEFFLYPELSVSGEYGLTLFSMTSRSDTETSVKGQKPVTTKNGSATQILGFGAAGATVHIYF